MWQGDDASVESPLAGPVPGAGVWAPYVLQLPGRQVPDGAGRQDGEQAGEWPGL